MNFYKHFLGDYARDTKGLSMIEHGAYRVLLDHTYATEQPIPNALAELYRIAGAMTAPERKAVEKVAERFFPVNGDGRRHNKRAEEEIGKHRLQVEHNRTVGALGGRPRKEPGNNPDGFQEGTRNVTRIEPGDNPSHSQKPERTKTSPAPAGEGRDGVATLPDCPHERLVDLYHEALPTCTRVVEWNDTRKALMRARWREQAVPNGKRPGYAKLEDGLAFWKRYFVFVGQSEFLTGKANPGPGKKPFVANLEWLIRPVNFAKVVEGNFQ